MDPEKVHAVQDIPVRRNKTNVRRSLGLTSYYRRFIEKYAERAKPLTELTKKKRPFVWMRDAEDSFEDLKKCFISAPILKSPDFSLQFKLYSDASNYGIGSVLAQESEDDESVKACTIRLLKSSEISYGVLQMEALGIVWSLKHFILIFMVIISL